VIPLIAAEHGKDALLVLVSALVGCCGLSISPSFSTLILAVPVFWGIAGSRLSAFAVVFAYKLAASRGVLPGAAAFLPEDHTLIEATALYLLISFGASLPFGIFWSKDGKRKAICLVLAFLVAYVLPPFSLIGMINPLMAAGAIFKGWGFIGISVVLGIYAICAVSRRTAWSFLVVITLFAILPPDSWYKPPTPEGIMAVDTSFGKLGSGSFDFERDYERANMVFSELRNRIGKDASPDMPDIVVLPETIAGRLNDTGLELWKDGLRESLGGKTVIFGAKLPTDGGMKYDNAALMLHDGEITVTRQRIPVPYSMYVPFTEGGANLHLSGDGILELPDGRTSAVIICYEAFLTWPILRSMTQKPDIIICMANLWWCVGTSIPASCRNAVSLWANLFGVPAVFAGNI
jgi:apolipoprotein N-acyltransferase